MEDSCEVHSEDDKGHPEKNKKRVIKTRPQVEALEKFYDEHKYPTETMKSELAESIGLTEKQVSGWFCHRRLKDKRLSNGEIYANGRQDRSSGVIQDHGSGFRQDSCGSTKQGDDKKFDHREVESRRLTGPEVSTADITCEVGTHFTGKGSGMDNASSRSSSLLRDECFSQNAGSFDIATSRYLPPNLPTDFKGVKPRSGPSGYLKVKGQVENTAITAVKRQLGRHYCPDGPPLGVEFDPLPPGAFESSVPNPVNDPYYYSREPIPACSPDTSKVYRQSNSCTGYESNSKTNSHNPDLDGRSFKRITKPAHPEYCFSQKSRQKPPEHNDYPRWNSSLDMHEGSVREMTVDRRDNFMAKHGRAEVRTSTRSRQKSSEHNDHSQQNSSLDMREGSVREMAVDRRDNFMLKHRRAEIRTDTGSSHGHQNPHVGHVNAEQAKPRFTSRSGVSRKVIEGGDLNCKPSKFTLKGSTYHNFGGRELTRKLDKEFISGNRTAADENYNLVRGNVPWHNETRVAKRARDAVPDHQENLRTASAIGMPLQTNQQIRSAAEMPSSFSEDEETEETSSFED